MKQSNLGLQSSLGAPPQIWCLFSRTSGNSADKLRMPRSAAYSAAE